MNLPKAHLRPCQPETIAKNSAATVQRCRDCGCLSLHVGPVTLRVDAATLEALWSVLGDAAHTLHTEEQPGSLLGFAAPRGSA